jgi:hypothetical protein
MRPDLDQAIDIPRLGKTVRFLPALTRPGRAALTPSFLLFPRYQPGSALSCAPMPPEKALQELVDAGAVIRDLTQEKLEKLCEWVTAIPTYGLTYHDVATGKSLVENIIESHVSGRDVE